MSGALRIAVSYVGLAVAVVVALILLDACLRDVVLEWRKWMSGTKTKRLGVTLGQRLEVEYQVTPETKNEAAGVEVQRVFAYSGAVRVEVTALVREMGLAFPHIEKLCAEAEGLPTIPF